MGRPQTLQCVDVSLSYGGVRACDSVSMTLTSGTVVGVVGPNGAGKTTLLGLLSGHHRADSGRVLLADRDVTGIDASGRARLGVRRTFQHSKIIPGMSVLENVMLARYADESHGMLASLLPLPSRVTKVQRARDRAMEALVSVGMDDVPNATAGALSHGKQRLLEVARAIAAAPAFLLLDEPAAGLTTAEVEHLEGLLRSLASNGMGVLLIEHNLGLVVRVADVLAVLDNGSAIAIGDPDEVKQRPTVMRVYTGVG